MSSTVFYRMFHGTTMEPIHFTGHHISLIDLKRAILDLKNISRGLDFDFKVMDAEDSTKVYTGDETLIPKNSSVIVVRTPASGQGLLARLKGRQSKAAPTKEDAIVIPAKPEPVATAKASVEVTESEELAALEAINEKAAAAAQSARPSWGLAPPPAVKRNTGAPPPNYECHRCGRPGHYIQNCPTNADPTYDKPKAETEGSGKLHGVPAITVQRVSDISTVNTTGKLIKNTKDGAFEIVESSEEGYNRLVKHGGATASTAALDMTQVPEMLKCALSGKLLRDPVTLPCCGKIVSDASVREALFKMDEYQCPLCRTTGITPDELRPNHEKKRQVEDFLANRTVPAPVVSPPVAPIPATLPPPRMQHFEQPPFMPPFIPPMPFMMPPMPHKPIWELFPLTRDEFRLMQRHQRQSRGEEFEGRRPFVPRKRSPSRDRAWYERRRRPDRRSRSRERRSISREKKSQSRDVKRSSSRDKGRDSRERRERSRDSRDVEKERNDRDKRDAKEAKDDKDKPRDKPRDERGRSRDNPRDERVRRSDDSRDDRDKPRDGREKTRDDKHTSRDDRDKTKDDREKSRDKPRDGRDKSRYDGDESRDDREKSRDKTGRDKSRDDRDKSRDDREKSKDKTKDGRDKSRDDRDKDRDKARSDRARDRDESGKSKDRKRSHEKDGRDSDRKRARDEKGRRSRDKSPGRSRR